MLFIGDLEVGRRRSVFFVACGYSHERRGKAECLNDSLTLYFGPLPANIRSGRLLQLP